MLYFVGMKKRDNKKNERRKRKRKMWFFIVWLKWKYMERKEHQDVWSFLSRPNFYFRWKIWKKMVLRKKKVKSYLYFSILRAFTMVVLKNLVFNTSKTYFIYFTIPLYNTPNIKGSIYFNPSFKYSFYLFYHSTLQYTQHQRFYLF